MTSGTPLSAPAPAPSLAPPRPMNVTSPLRVLGAAAPPRRARRRRSDRLHGPLHVPRPRTRPASRPRHRAAVPRRLRLRPVRRRVVEAARVDGLYGFGLPARRLRRAATPGFGGWLLGLWRQAIDPSVWRGIASLAVATILGWIVVLLLSVFSSGIAMAFAPLYATGRQPADRPHRTRSSRSRGPSRSASSRLSSRSPRSSASPSCTAFWPAPSSCPPVKRSSPRRPAPPAPSAPEPCVRPMSSARASSATSTTASSRDSCRSA